MNGILPLWGVLIVTVPLLASLLLLAGMLFSSRTRAAVAIPAFAALLFTCALSLAITTKSDAFLPILLGGPSVVLVATVVALTRALKKPYKAVSQRPDELEQRRSQ